jgi:hypothetical protein
MDFDISRLRRADQVIAGGGIAFFIFLFFFKWWGVSYSGAFNGVHVGGGFSYSGWHTYSDSRWIWIITIIVALASVVLVALQRKLELPIQPGVIVAGLGLLSVIFIVYRIISPIGSGSVSSIYGGASAGNKIGIYLGLISAAVVTYGGYLSMQDEGTSISQVREQASQAFGGLTSGSGQGSTRPPAGSGDAPAPPAPPIPPPSSGSNPPPSQDA